MRRALLFALALSACATPANALPPPAIDRLEPLRFLEGCWIGTFEGSDLQDRRCYERDLDGHILRDRHEVVGTGYGGETIYAWNEETRRIEVTYYANDGGRMTGRVAEEDDGFLWMRDGRYVGEIDVQILRSRWVRSGEGGFTVESDRLENGAWVRFMTITYVSAPAPP